MTPLRPSAAGTDPTSPFSTTTMSSDAVGVQRVHALDQRPGRRGSPRRPPRRPLRRRSRPLPLVVAVVHQPRDAVSPVGQRASTAHANFSVSRSLRVGRGASVARRPTRSSRWAWRNSSSRPRIVADVGGDVEPGRRTACWPRATAHRVARAPTSTRARARSLADGHGAHLIVHESDDSAPAMRAIGDDVHDVLATHAHHPRGAHDRVARRARATRRRASTRRRR